MDAQIHDLPFDPATLQGVSEKLLRSHHQNNYSGAVKRLNSIRAQLREPALASAPGSHVNGLKCEELIAMHGRAQGLNARFLVGGSDGWQAAGRPLADKPKG